MAIPIVDFVLFREGNAWVARGLNLEVSSCGESREEARRKFGGAVALHLDGEDLDGLPTVAELSFEQLSVALPLKS